MDYAISHNQSRKTILASLLKRISPLPVWYPGTYELYCKLWRVGGVLHMPFFNIGRDDLDELELAVTAIPEKVETLQPSGVWKELLFHASGKDRIVLESEFRSTTPFVLRFSGL